MAVFIEFAKSHGSLVRLGDDTFSLPIQAEAPLWELELQPVGGGAPRHLTAFDCPPPEIAHDGAGFQLSWRLPGELAVEATAKCCGQRCEWGITLKNLTSDQCVTEVHFPLVGKFGPQENDYLALPWQWGMLVPDPVRTAATVEA